MLLLSHSVGQLYQTTEMCKITAVMQIYSFSFRVKMCYLLSKNSIWAEVFAFDSCFSILR